MAIRNATKTIDIVRFGDQTRDKADLLAVEEPMEIRLEYGPLDQRIQRNVAVTMRTPGHDLELAAGFLFSEGILQSANDIFKIDWCNQVASADELGNVVKVELLPGCDPPLEKMDRNFYMTSSCGVCGKSSIAAIHVATCAAPTEESPVFSADFIRQLPQTADARQTIFKYTGGIHAATVFDVAGNLIVQHEDIGRHNAVDKVIGAQLLAGNLSQEGQVLLVSGRAGFELVQKAIVAGFSMMVAIGAPSSLAVDLAKQHGLTLVGFLRGNRFNCYAGAERIV